MLYLKTVKQHKPGRLIFGREAEKQLKSIS
jgi:hypothetical protein